MDFEHILAKMVEDHRYLLPVSLLVSEMVILLLPKLISTFWRSNGHSDITSLDFSSVFDTHPPLWKQARLTSTLLLLLHLYLYIGCLVLLEYVEGGDFKEKLFLEILLEFHCTFLKFQQVCSYTKVRLSSQLADLLDPIF